MMAGPAGRGPVPGLIDRDTERAVLDQFVVGVRAGEGQVLVLRGEPGVGKTILLGEVHRSVVVDARHGAHFLDR
jgi:predicted ATPase